jgi:alpha-tubulin suppressor-like RCC1 family protein
VDWSSDDEAEENKKEQQKQKSQVKSKKQELEVAENHQAQLKHFEDSEDEEDDHEEEAAQEEEEQEEDALDHEQDILDPVKLFSLCGEGINHIAVGRYHCCAKTKDGDVYTWGQNDHAQLGLESVHILSEALSKKARVRYGSDQFEPVLWQRSVGETVIITSVDVGTSHTVAVTSKAEVVAFGAVFNTTENSTLSRCLGKLSVAQVSCGALHAGLVTTNGQAYTWGSGDGGRLGHGDNTSYVNPRLVEALKEDIVFEISCACWHTVAIILVPPLLKGGLVYTWGSGRLGQLAQGDKQISSSPGLVTDLLTTHVLVKKICTGMYHTVVLSVDDEVLTWGSNQNGCLGRPEELHGLEENFCAVPGQVEGLQNFVGRPCGIAAGREFTLIVTKPYLGMSQSELDQKKQEQEAVKNSISNQRKQLILEKKEKLLEIQNEKQKWIIQQLNLLYPKCSLCKHGLVCPGFQKNQANPAICLHCMHERKQHDDLHLVTTSTLSYLLQVIDKLKIEMDFSKIKEIEFENLLEKEIETLIEEEQEQEQEQEQE